MVQQRMYKYRLYPSQKQKARILNNLKTCKTIYNELLATSMDAYKFGKVSLSKFDYDAFLKGQYPAIYSQVRQNVSDRVHKAFQNFFRRVKDKSYRKKGFPRFKSRVNSITYTQYGFKFISDKRLYASKIGNIPIVLHRIPKGKIKTMTIKVNRTGQWFAIFSCEIDVGNVKHPSKDVAGIDVGLEYFATLSNGEHIDNPHFFIKSEKRLKLLQRRLSRKRKDSANRRKARFKVAKHHIKITNQRTDFLHKLSRSLAFRYKIIAGEDLNIKNMVRNHFLAKSISDASWGIFINMLSYKEVMLGGQFLKNPETRGSSHRCSKCGFCVDDMPLSRKIFKCSKCLNVLHRDHNSALNHIQDTVGLTEISTPVDIEPLQQNSSVASLIAEAGTTYGK